MFPEKKQSRGDPKGVSIFSSFSAFRRFVLVTEAANINPHNPHIDSMKINSNADNNPQLITDKFITFFPEIGIRSS
jgi:hypothetical protein